MEQRHGQVTTTVRTQRVALSEHGADKNHAALRAPARFWLPSCAGCEDEISERIGADVLEVWCDCFRPVRDRVGVHDDDTRVDGRGDPDAWTQVQALDQVQVPSVGDEQLTSGMGKLFDQRRAAMRWVHADEHRSRECARSEPPDVFGYVVEQHGDMGWTGLAQTGPEPGTAEGLVDHLAPGPFEVTEPQARVRIAGTCHPGLGHRPHRTSSSARGMLGRRPSEPFPQFGEGLFERRTTHGPALRLELGRDRGVRVMDGCGGVERALDSCRQLGVVLAGASGEARSLSRELVAAVTTPDKASTGGLFAVEHLTEEGQCSGTLPPQAAAGGATAAHHRDGSPRRGTGRRISSGACRW